MPALTKRLALIVESPADDGLSHYLECDATALQLRRSTDMPSRKSEVTRQHGWRPSGTERQLSADSVEKVDILLGLRQNQVIGQREDSQHDGTIVEWTRETVLLVQH